MSGVQTPSVLIQTLAAGTGGGAAPTVLGQVTVTQLPDKLTGLARALAVSGMVTEQQGDQATVRTAAGDVQVRTEAPLPTDRPVTLQIPAQAAGAATTATVVAQSAAQSAQGTSQASAPPQAAPTPLASNLPPLQVGATLAAVLLSPAPASGGTAAPSSVPAPSSDINQGLGLGLIVGARGDTGDQPDLTDDSPSQQQQPSPAAPPSQGRPTAPQTGTGGQATTDGDTAGQAAPPGASPQAPPNPGPQNPPASTSGPLPTPWTVGSLADLLFARATGGTPAATANPPSLGDLLPDIAPPSAPTVPTPGVSAAASTQAAASQPTGTSPAPEAPSSGTPSAPAGPGPQGQLNTAPDAPPSPGQPRGGPTSPPASALATPGVLPDLGAPGPAQSSGPPLSIPAPAVPRGASPEFASPQVASPLPTSPQPASSSGPAPSADGATPFVSGGVFLSGRPSFVRTGLPSGTTTPFPPSPASLPTPASPPIAQGSSVPGPPAPSVAAGTAIPSASPAVPDWTGATAPSPQAPGARPLAGLTGQLTPSPAPAADGKTASPLAGPARPVGMTPAMTLPPGALSPQEATAPPLPAATPPGASAYTAPVQVSTAPNPGQTINLTVLSVQRPGMAVEVMPGAPGDMAPTMDDAPLDPALARPGVAPTAPGSAIPGTVVGVTRAGQPVVETPRGTLLLQARADLPVGTKVRLAPAALPTPDLDPVPPAIDPARGRDWPALRETLAVIAATDPALARHLIDSVLPRPTPQLTKTLVIFLAALRGGDAGGWLGADALSTLGKAGRGRLSARLTDDFNTIANQAAEPNKDGWRTYAVPFGDEVGRLQVHVRAINEEEGEEAEGPARAQRNRPLRRFLIDLTLSRLGPMQLDGLIWTGRFDLVIRTRQLLPTSLTRELHGIYSNSLAAVGYSGALAFQTGAHGWVDQAAPASGAKPVTRI